MYCKSKKFGMQENLANLALRKFICPAPGNISNWLDSLIGSIEAVWTMCRYNVNFMVLRVFPYAGIDRLIGLIRLMG